jgi:hypothetical protein
MMFGNMRQRQAMPFQRGPMPQQMLAQMQPKVPQNIPQKMPPNMLQQQPMQQSQWQNPLLRFNALQGHPFQMNQLFGLGNPLLNRFLGGQRWR